MPKTKAKLLIVDDDASIRRALLQLFTANGYNVRLAEEGSSALTKIESEVPDIILSDLQMPGMSGFEFLSLVHFQFPTIHLIAMSAAFSGSRVPPGVAAEAFYAKGSSLRPLLQTMEAMTESEPGAEPAAPWPCRPNSGPEQLHSEEKWMGNAAFLARIRHRTGEFESMRPLAPNSPLRSVRMGRARYGKITMYSILGLGFWLAVALLFWFIIYLATRLSGQKHL